jgi:hypothetical protein
MRKFACATGLVCVLWTTGQAKAGGPPPAQIVVEKIVFEPNDKTPTRIQIWGYFSLLKNGSSYGSPVKGYLYYAAEQGKEDKCRKEWEVLKKATGKKEAVSFGCCGRPRDLKEQLRKPAATIGRPAVYPVGEGGFHIETNPTHSFPELKSLVVLLAPPEPAERTGRVAGRTNGRK